MALSDLDVKAQYTGDGANTTFAIPYTSIFDANTETKVYEGDTLKTLVTDYNIVAGDIEFNVAPASSVLVTVTRVLTLNQTLDLVSAGSVNLETLEKHLDGIMAKIQQIDEELKRAPKFKTTIDNSSLADASLVLPVPVADELLSWNAAGDALENKSAADLATGVVTDGMFSPYLPFSITDGQAATDLSGETADNTVHSSIVYHYEVRRGTTVLANGRASMQSVNGTWEVHDGGSESSVAHGITFSVSQTTTVGQLRVALDSGAGSGTIKLSKQKIPI